MSDVNDVKEWVETIREDIEALKAVLDSPGTDDEAKKFAAAGLNYLVARMDLVPDWEESIGMLDDAMIIRLLADLASQCGLGDDLSATNVAALGRLANEADIIEDVIGVELEARLRTYCSRLKDDSVRGRSPIQIATDAAIRKTLYDEVEAELLRVPPAPFADPEPLIAKFKSYLHHKLEK